MQEPRDRTGRRNGSRSYLRRTFMVLPLVIALSVIGVIAVGSARSATHASTTVSLRTTKLGMILVNSSGHTLYLFAKDTNGKSACSGSCAKFWPPLTSVGMPAAGKGVKKSLLGTTKRSNGSLQVTYKSHPLYTFALDKTAGQTSGEGNVAFGAKWYAVSAKGTAVVKAVATSPPTTTTTPAPNPYP